MVKALKHKIVWTAFLNLEVASLYFRYCTSAGGVRLEPSGNSHLRAEKTDTVRIPFTLQDTRGTTPHTSIPSPYPSPP